MSVNRGLFLSIQDGVVLVLAQESYNICYAVIKILNLLETIMLFNATRKSNYQAIIEQSDKVTPLYAEPQKIISK